MDYDYDSVRAWIYMGILVLIYEAKTPLNCEAWMSVSFSVQLLGGNSSGHPLMVQHDSTNGLGGRNGNAFSSHVLWSYWSQYSQPISAIPSD